MLQGFEQPHLHAGKLGSPGEIHPLGRIGVEVVALDRRSLPPDGIGGRDPRGRRVDLGLRECDIARPVEVSG